MLHEFVKVLLHKAVQHRFLRPAGNVRRGKPGHAARFAGTVPTTAPSHLAELASASPVPDRFLLSLAMPAASALKARLPLRNVRAICSPHAELVLHSDNGEREAHPGRRGTA